ncbi:TorF family putative porin [Methylocella tundrae]|uniref:Uncharacterized protein n=1 Tax=Methylocella tundrae TaxID=227605 RepID=A0A4U8Z152_METTU|nr:TorF family putative porin [Methylocella tundrae]WPP06323.1 TorF family putative porin [Methylocella tundrae]VFU09015.1 conserved exported protein of unknown function [Methylocella tundrae]
MSGRTNTLLSLLAGILLSASAPIAYAADLAATPAPAPATPPIDFAFGMKLANDYVFRGVDQSNGHFAAQGYVEARLLDFAYLGAWTSNVSFPTAYGLTNPAAEVDLYGGLRHTWGALTLDVGALYYEYPNQSYPLPGQVSINYYEVYFKPTYVINDTFTVGGNLFVTNNYVNTGAGGTYLSGTLKANLPPLLPYKDIATYISGEVGEEFLGTARTGLDLPSYTTWNVGIGATWNVMTLDLRYSGSSLSRGECTIVSGVPNWCGNRFIASLAIDTTLLTLGK